MTTGKSVQELHTNSDMANMLASMESYVESARGKFGYAIARNIRKLNDACAEFLQARQDLMEQFGEQKKDASGNVVEGFFIKIGTPACDEFLKQIGEYSNIEHTVEIYKIPYDILPEELTAKDLLALDWMLYDE